jgi:hypothetical protein
MHEHYLEDDFGDLVDIVPFCSDSCHRDWCATNDETYGGWNGCHETEFDQWCASCGVIIGGFQSAEDDDPDGECDHRYPVIVNLIGEPEAEYCEHGTLIRAAV